ncbi:MAG: regulatory protein RecX [Dehalogenimonas sp.]|uniref:Regulatory protein RecX n=1 Tax=Candidatus Dehalogenimonas loeffleri TaxID=3127115 RepID=A0ABZ2J6Y3_9CHLR|nr:regulatory protein RecX [Dehalogenimonas sp.]
MPKRQTGARPLADGAEDNINSPAGESGQRAKSETDNACFQAAVRLLAHRARTETEMRQRLTRKKFEPETVDRVIDRLKQSGLIDDAAFARAWSDSRSFASPRSTYVIKQELRLKGIPVDTAEAAVEDLDDAASAMKAAAGRAGRLANLPAEEAKQKLADFLRRRGFGWELTRQTLEQLESEGLLGQVDTTEGTP